ncbi:unnamed protein product [Boreogadus saida]
MRGVVPGGQLHLPAPDGPLTAGLSVWVPRLPLQIHVSDTVAQPRSRAGGCPIVTNKRQGHCVAFGSVCYARGTWMCGVEYCSGRVLTHLWQSPLTREGQVYMLESGWQATSQTWYWTS